jgi:futalosine hydrolase
MQPDRWLGSPDMSDAADMRTLILVPTDLERRVIEPIVAPALGAAGMLELCGFGPVAAAARTALLVERLHPDRVVLVGIAGRLDDQFAIAAAYRFAQVACFGIGVGSGEAFLPAGAAEWPQWPGDPGDGSPAIGDLIDCRSAGPATSRAGLLLTACAASATPDDVRLRKRWFPAAAAEDMEGFAVAFACRLRGVPLDVIRGISNTAGDRDKTRWDISGGLRAAGDLAVQTIAEAP